MRSFDGLSRTRPKRKRTGPTIIDAPAPRRSKRGSAGGFFALLIIGGLVLFGLNSFNSNPDSSKTNSDDNQEPAKESAIANLELPQGGLSDDQSLEDLLIIDSPNQDSADQTIDSANDKEGSLPIIRVLNGGAASGSASEIENSLKTRGFEVLSVGNANNPHEKTTLYYKSGFQKDAESLTSDFNLGEVNYIEDNIAEPADILIVLGQNY